MENQALLQRVHDDGLLPEYINALETQCVCSSDINEPWQWLHFVYLAHILHDYPWAKSTIEERALTIYIKNLRGISIVDLTDLIDRTCRTLITTDQNVEYYEEYGVDGSLRFCWRIWG